MRRRLLNLLTVLSLLLCAGIVALWVRSHVASDLITHGRITRDADHSEGTDWIIDIGGGRITIARSRSWFHGSGTVDEVHRGWTWNRDEPLNVTFRWAADPTLAHRLGFHWSADEWTSPYGSWMRTRSIGFPAWALAAPAAILPGTRFYRRIRRRHRAGLCPSCGYDLRVTPAQCPECGHTAAGATG